MLEKAICLLKTMGIEQYLVIEPIYSSFPSNGFQTALRYR